MLLMTCSYANEVTNDLLTRSIYTIGKCVTNKYATCEVTSRSDKRVIWFLKVFIHMIYNGSIP